MGERIFISHRHQEGGWGARELCHHLRLAFNDAVVFDADSLHLGEDWRDEVIANMRGCDVMLVMIGKNWNPERLKYENDGVRFELDHAKTLKCKVIPVILDEAVMPHPEELPPELGHITYILGLPFRWQSANDDATRIIELVKSYREGGRTVVPPPPPPEHRASPVPVKGADVPPLPPLPPPAFRPSRRRRQPRTLAIAGATAAVLIGGIVIAAAIDRHGSSASTPTTPVPSSAVTTPTTTTPTTTIPTTTIPTTTTPTTESVTFVATTISAPPVTTVPPIPIQQAPAAPPAQTLCIRSDIDFAALRDAPDLAANLLAQIPPGSCDVILMDPTTVRGNGFGWYHVQWSGIAGWTAKTNTA